MQLRFGALLGGVLLATACSDPPSESGGSGGSANSQGGQGVAGATASGGHSSGGSTPLGLGGQSTSGGASSGGASSGGASSGGTTSSGGATSGGATSGSGGSTAAGGTTASAQGGKTAGGAGGAATGGSGGGANGETAGPAQPSSGCGKTNPQVGSSGSPLTVSSHQYYVKLPTSYDANKAYMVIFMFNPTGNPLNWAEQNAGFESNGAKTSAIRVYPGPASMASGWGAGDVSFFKPLYDAVTANYCVDKARMFAFGESSGGDFVSILGCEYADLLRGVGPCSTKDVPAYPLDATKRKCKGQVTAVVIHGKNDNVVGPANGPKTRDFYAALNHCGTMTQPVAGYTDTLSNCVQYQGCDAAYPVFWCQHTDPNYSNTNHGWPAFAPKFLWEKFSKY